MREKSKRLLPAILALMLCVLALGQASAAGIEYGVPTLGVNNRKVVFAGRVWWVIGNENGGVYSQEGHITLLAVGAKENAAFRKINNEGNYADNPDGTKWVTPNEYAGSTLQQTMEEIANGFPAKEQAVITARTLVGGGTSDNPSSDGIAGQGIANQKLWALSEAEWNKIKKEGVREFEGASYWWLRTPCQEAVDDRDIRAMISLGSGNGLSNGLMWTSIAVRPAFSLDLSSVLFTSTATKENGKDNAIAGGNLVTTQKATGRVKFTMKDDSQTLTVNATEAQSVQTGGTLSFGYTGATTGANQYVSCILTDQSNAVKYYGKLADSSSAASGTLSVPLAGVADGTYTLHIFSEEANAVLYTDFCSEPVTMTVTVASGSGTVSNFGGTILHEHSWSSEWSSNEACHWHACSGCDEKKDEKAHDFRWENAREATCIEEGYTGDKICTVCQYTVKGSVIPKGAHQYQDGVCIICGAEDPGHHEYDINVQSGGHGTAHASYTSTEAGVWVLLSVEAEEGYHLERWEVVSGDVEIKGNTFLMPDEDVTVRAIFAPDVITTVPPKTGDDSHIGLWSALMLMGLCGVAGLVIGRRSGHAGKR